MRLAIATPLYPPESGGPATFAKILETELPAHGWRGETVRFAAVRHLPWLVRHVVYGWHVLQAARRADAVLALDPTSTGLPALLAARLAGKPFYVRIAGDYAWEQGNARFKITDSLDTFVCKTNYPLRVRVMKAVQTYVAIASSGVIVPSKYLAKVVHLWNIPRELITVAYNAAPTITDAPAKPAIDAPYIVSVSRLVKWKGMAGVIHAFPEIQKEQPDLKLVIVGDGPERAHLEALVKDLGLSNSVILTGSLTQEEALGWIAHAEAFVLNTRYEGLSHLVLEAFALEVPVLTTNAGGNPELVTEGETGLLFVADDARGMCESIAAVRGNKKLRAKMVKGAKEHADTFTKTRMIEDVMAALSKHSKHA